MSVMSISKQEVTQGDFLRNAGNGTRIVQVLRVDDDKATLINAGSIKGGIHSPPERTNILNGELFRNKVIVSHQIYVKVDINIDLENLTIDARNIKWKDKQ